jgi:hypothetical protein
MRFQKKVYWNRQDECENWNRQDECEDDAFGETLELEVA